MNLFVTMFLCIFYACMCPYFAFFLLFCFLWYNFTNIIIMEVMNMGNYNRYDAIMKLLMQHKKISVDTLATKLNVTPTTIRRDLLILEEKRQITRTRGYAHLNENFDFAFDGSIIEDMFKEEKMRIAKKAVELVYHEATIFLDSGSTLLEFAKEINMQPHLSNINIVTHSYDIASTISNNQHISMPGGVVHHSSHSLFGVETADFFSAIHAEVAFMGTNGFCDCPGLTVSLPLMLQTKKNMVKSAQRIVALADSSKFIGRGLYTYCDFSDVDTLITVSTPENKKKIDELRDMGIEIILA